jgi:predicted outer membrane repeat protein
VETRLARRLILLAAALAASAAGAHATSSIYTVTATGSGGVCTGGATDDANCTLDAAIATASAGDIVQFGGAAAGHTIVGYWSVSKDLTIDASPNGVTLDGNNYTNVLYIDSGASVTFRHLTVQHGIGNNSGGGLYMSSGNATIDSCTFVANNATLTGGAISSQSGGTIQVFNSTFANNHSGYTSGAIYAGGTVVIASSTFAHNTADNNSGAMLLLGTFTSLGHNFIGSVGYLAYTSGPGDQVGVDPQLATTTPTDNGGPTATFDLLPGSPARSGGDCSGNASAPEIPPSGVDQRGLVRSVPCTAGAVDMTSIFYGTFD